MRTLNEREINTLRGLEPGWKVADDGKSVSSQFSFETFAQAWTFMTEIAFAAEANDHHPEWCNVYSRLEIKLTTHDADGLTERDLKLAQVIRAAYTRPKMVEGHL